MGIYYCKNENRRSLISGTKDPDGKPVINGIDYLEIASHDQKQISLFFIHPPPGLLDQTPSFPLSLSKENFRITGGERIKDIKILSVVCLPPNEIRILVDRPGDFSTYKLSIVTSSENTETLVGFDPQLSSVDFSFKVSCPNDFDCKTETDCPPERLFEPEIDYLSKDYNSFRKLMFDRLSIIMPGWHERNPADLQVALVELLAYVGDHLSYYQDAVATEAYLETARKRISVRRHARLLDYRINDGCNSRVWIQIDVTAGGDAEGQVLQIGTPFCTEKEGDELLIKDSETGKMLEASTTIFESMHNLTLFSANNEISFYTWRDTECCLPKGSTKASLKNINKNGNIKLSTGDVLIFEEIKCPDNGKEPKADPDHRHAVRIKTLEEKTDQLDGTLVTDIEWYEEDALPFPLCISSNIMDSNGIEYDQDEISIARGNVVLADYGYTKKSEKAYIKDDYLYALKIDKTSDANVKNLTFRQNYDHEVFRNKAATLAISQDPRKAVPAIHLEDTSSDNDIWLPIPDLLGSDRFANEFICETENDGSVYIRFGDDICGKKPSNVSDFRITYRLGNGTSGNVGSDSIKRVVTDFTGISKINNPLSATGGKDPESIERVKQIAPYAFRVQQRAVTAKDYSEVTERHKEVQKAASDFRWTGSWNTVFVTVDRKNGVEIDEEFENEISDHIELYRMAGHDIEVNKPVFVPLDIEIDVCVKEGYFRSDVKETLRKTFSNKVLSNGQQGFFHPDNFTFGQPVYLSRLYFAAMGIDGISSVEIRKFQRFGKSANQEKENGILQTASIEIIRLDNDPNFPENGKLNFNLHGGL